LKNLISIVAVALKQSRDIIFYQISEDENKKLKLIKMDKYIKSTRKFGIKHLAISKCGTYLASSGSDQDTLIQIFDISKGTLTESIDTNEINNIDLEFSPCDNYLTVSTYMYEIAIMEFKRSIKFNKAINGDETTLKVEC
jgi:WD40 repeat protein